MDAKTLADLCALLPEGVSWGEPLTPEILQHAVDRQAAELEALRAENANLKTVMIAAAEEIHAHWDAHCNAEGYGPQNLMRRLEEGIPSEYGYTVGAFAALRAERDAAIGQTAIRCMEMAMWPQGIDDEQAYYGRMFAEFIEREFKAAIGAARAGGGK